MMYLYLKMLPMPITGFCNAHLQWVQRVRLVIVSCWLETYSFVFATCNRRSFTPVTQLWSDATHISYMAKKPLWRFLGFAFGDHGNTPHCLTAIFTLHAMQHTTLWQTCPQLPRADCTSVSWNTFASLLMIDQNKCIIYGSAQPRKWKESLKRSSAVSFFKRLEVRLANRITDRKQLCGMYKETASVLKYNSRTLFNVNICTSI